MQRLQQEKITYTIIMADKCVIHPYLKVDSLEFLRQGFDSYLKDENFLNVGSLNLFNFTDEYGYFRGVIVTEEDISEIVSKIDDYILLPCCEKIIDVFKGSVLEESIKQVIRNPDKMFYMSDIAQNIGYSLGYCQKHFKIIYGDSYLNFYRPFKVKYAKRLIELGIPLSELYERVGFADRSYFDKVFKKIEGVSPGEYRRKNDEVE